MPSITYWSRVEPRARAQSIAESVAARVRDPLWFLARQWQLGEFAGEDAATAAFAQVEVGVGGLRAWSADDAGQRRLGGGPLEPSALAEGFAETDLSLAVELGLVFERALGDQPDLVEAFRGAFGFASAPERDVEAARFVEVATERVTHGLDLLRAAEQAAPGLPPAPALAPADEGVVRAALDELRNWVAETVGTVGGGDARSWDAERLEYALQVTGDHPAGGDVALTAHPARDGRCGWYSFDEEPQPGPGGGPGDAVTRIRRSVIPGNVTFRGMPNARFWAFESGTTNLGAIRPEKREVAKLVVLDFLLVHSNDWYVLPFRQPLGTLARVESLVQHDVFGGVVSIERAGGGPAAAGTRWTLFSTSLAGRDGVADYLFLPPSVGTAAQRSDVVEEVRFVRDEMANIAWGVERVVENAIGEPWPAHERALPAGEPTTGPASDGSLSYRIQTDVPENWIPFVPVAVNVGRRDVQLERGVLLRSEDEPPREPAGRILRPTESPGRYRLREEELPRTGLRVARTVNRARWVDGSTYVWIAREKRLEGREERSGLLFDVAGP